MGVVVIGIAALALQALLAAVIMGLAVLVVAVVVINRAAANASRGQVKNLAEKPLFCSMAARVDALTRSSSTTKMRES
jgi:hypothetical protein